MATSEPFRRDRCAAAQRSEFLACKREQGFFFSRASGGLSPLRLPSLDHHEAMAAVAPQPVLVDSPAGAPTSDCPIFLAANSEVVSSTPCLDWQPAQLPANKRTRSQAPELPAL